MKTIPKADLPGDALDPWFLEHLYCPIDQEPFTATPNGITCAGNHSFPVVNGVPILLNPENTPVFLKEKDLNELLNDEAAAQLAATNAKNPHFIDPHVQEAIGATNGIMYENLIGRLTEYPIPNIPLPKSIGATFLDIGCNWGRWSVSAARLGYKTVGIDPNPRAVFAAKRVAKQLGLPNRYLVADARFLPFKPEIFQTVFSYSVLQHFAKEDVRRVLTEVRRVMLVGGTCKIQMGNTYGVRSLYHQARRGFGEAKAFDVRYWTPSELQRDFSRLIGDTQLSVDGFFSLNPQAAEAHLLSPLFRMVVKVSDLLRGLSLRMKALLAVADSLYVTSVRRH